MVYSPINGKYQEIHPCWRNSIKINSSLLVIIRVHKIHLMKGSGCSRKFYLHKKPGSSKEIVSLNARISVMKKLRPQPRDKNREIDDRTESERGEVLWVVRENLG